MKSFRFLIGLLLVTIIVLIVALFSSRLLDVVRDKTQAVVILNSQAKRENIVNSSLPTPVELEFNSPLPTPTGSEFNSPLPTPPDETGKTTQEPFGTPVPRSPVPYPSFDVKTNSILDAVVFTNMRAFQLPSADHTSYGLTSWSPDSEKFVGFFSTSPETSAGTEDKIAGLYLGDPATGKQSMLIANGVWSTWSSNGQGIYYVAPRREQEVIVDKPSGVPYYDLYKYDLSSKEQRLIASDVGTPYVAQSPVNETVNGDLLLFDARQRISKLENLGRFLENNQSAKPNDFTPLSALLVDQQLADVIREASYTFFSVAPTGDLAAVIPLGNPFFILDLTTNSVVAQLDENPQYASNVAWSSDGKRLAYTSQSGVYIYDLSTGMVSTLIQGKDVGFDNEDIRSGFFAPAWILDEQVLIFTVKSGDWIYDARIKRPGYLSSFVFAATIDGAHWRPISALGLESVAPNGKYAIVYDWDPQAQLETKFVIDIFP